MNKLMDEKFLKNFQLKSKKYIQTHWPYLGLTLLIILSRPIYKRSIRRLLWSMTSGQQVRTRQELFDLVGRDREVWLRVKVNGQIMQHDDSSASDDSVIPITQDVFKHAFRLTHCPLFAPRSSSDPASTSEVERSVGSTALLEGEVAVKLAGVNYPLHERAVKELQMPRVKLFSTHRDTYWYCFISHHENKNITESEPLRVWLFPSGIFLRGRLSRKSL